MKFVNNGKEEKHCGFCGSKHKDECNPNSFLFYKCECGETHFMPWDSVAFCGLGGIFCACDKEASECWQSISYEQYLEFTQK